MRYYSEFLFRLATAFFMTFAIFVTHVVFSQISEHRVIAEFLINVPEDNNNPLTLGYVTETGGYGPSSLAVDRKGNIYILDTIRSRVLILDSLGNKKNSIDISDGLRRIGSDLCVDSAGVIYILDRDVKYDHQILFDELGYPDMFNHNLPAMIRLYSPSGVKLAEYYISDQSLRGKPNCIYINSEKKLYIGYKAEVVEITRLELKYEDSFKVYIAHTSEMIRGIPVYDSPGKFLTLKKHKERFNLTSNKYIAFEDSIKNYNSIFDDNFQPGYFFSRGNGNSICIKAINKTRWKDRSRDKKYFEVLKFDANGHLRKHFVFQKNWNSRYTRDMICDHKGDILYLYLNQQHTKGYLVRMK